MADPFVSCPYEKTHRVPQSRIQGHIAKCQKNFPIYHICPYNATHRYENENNFKHHVTECSARFGIMRGLPSQRTGALGTLRPMLQKEYLPESDPDHEIWDK